MSKVASLNEIVQAKGRPSQGDFFITHPATLALAGGHNFDGTTPEGQSESLMGEVVFNTGMTGYAKTLTDPSYAGQIIVFTFPLIGNYGVPPASGWESSKIHASGVVVSELAAYWDHAGHTRSLAKWLREQNVPIITGVDTRALTKYLRTRGTMPGKITPDQSTSLPTTIKLTSPAVTCLKPEVINPGRPKTIVAIDCGMKQNIVRSLTKRGFTVRRVPSNYDYIGEDYDGLLVSNGPGDPTDYEATIAVLRRALTSPKPKPVFGICLGAQLMGLAAGASTYKLPFGHRGHNQPVIAADSQRAYITSQNHGYAIAEDSLPKDWRVTFRNLNDGSVEGIAHRSKPFFAAQFHPEAAPGPTDTNWLFNEFAQVL